MVISIARQSVILKCLRQKSVLLGNYEFYYLAGLLKKCFGLETDKDMRPQELSDYIQSNLEGLASQDEREEYLLQMVRYYLPQEQYDEQMRELFEWGATETDLWKVETGRNG